jgi:isopenicillin N synthase-like dioxygenase
MKYTKFTSPEIEQLADGLWSRGHTDLGTITLLFRQPVAALQIRDHVTGDWKWAKPLDGSLTVNTCDALSFLTGGYIKSTVHRVSLPPADQRHVDRLGLLYFARPQNDLPLATVASPVLQREGYTQNEFEKGGHKVPTMGGESILVTEADVQNSRPSSKSGSRPRGSHGTIRMARRLFQALLVSTTRFT